MHVFMVLVYLGIQYEVGDSRIYEESLPKEFTECLTMVLPNSEVKRDPAYVIDYACANKFLTSTPNDRWTPEVDSEAERQVTEKANNLEIQTKTKSLQYEKKSIQKHFQDNRPKRSSRTSTIVRKEYRRMSGEEREKFHRALQLLKDDRNFTGKETKFNLYDTLCNLHHASSAPHAHFGPAFLAWHRVSLYIFEQLLRSKVPGVTVPYWDSTVDGLLENPTATALFTDELMGPGVGVVTTGYFANWSHPFAGDLVRNIGNVGELIQKEDLKRLVNVGHTKEFMFPFASSYKNLELIHGKVHMWVSGTMNNLNYSPADPIFWLHHCFIDYIWEKIRQKQKERGIDPRFDYPNGVSNGHQPDDRMKPFQLKNKDGFMIDWSTIYEYEESPGDINCEFDFDCGSPYYACDGGNCRAKTVDEMIFYFGSEKRRRRRSVTELNSSNVTTESSPTTTPHQTLFVNSMDPSNSIDMQSTPLFHSMQNTFMINGKEDSKAWVEIPIIIYSRRPTDLVFDAHPVRRGEVNLTSDVYQTSEREEEILPHTGDPATIEKCQHLGSGASKVFLRSVGVNYEGDYTSDAIVDERQTLTITLTQVAVKNPYKNYTKAYISAYDRCGRMCKPYCLTGSNSTYKKCTGSIGVDSRMPKMYNSDFAGAILHTFDYSTFPPKLAEKNIFLIFYCGKEEDWPWLMNDEKS